MSYSFPIEQIEEILRTCPEYESGHHMRRPYMSAYQLAIAFSEQHPQHPAVMNLSLGGMGAAAHESLAQQIARFLSQSILRGSSGEIEGAFVSHMYIESLRFSAPGHAGSIAASTIGTKHAQSIFRLRDRVVR